ncbi:hypothetical protein POM88_032182 [Heracleum sosnowskyi]|uniref:ABC transporter domain-containing protein n=1 Tax=Heracleum sosnowskyi TaxID=360622 RepID=A0AAD8I018_9APIA|nr:hypothetical protein POM88_032182 [Heracleum sosnowskyi]
MEDRYEYSTTISITDQDTNAKKDDEDDAVVLKEIDAHDGKKFIDKFFAIPEEDNDQLLRKIRARIDKVGIDLPKVEVRFQNLTVEGNCLIGDRALPTLPNVARNIAESVVSGCLGIKLGGRANHTILKDASGIIKPSRMTLLLGPPSSGKTTLLMALAGMLDSNLKVVGEISYNGCQGVGSRYELVTELQRKEKEAGIVPDPEVNFFMKQTAMEGVENCFITEYTLKILGLDTCRDTIIGNEMQRGISGGEKKRVTTGEMIVGPTKTLFMDDISTGLDSSTAFQICPQRKGIADYLQEVTSKKNQEHYWADRTQTYEYISVTEFAESTVWLAVTYYTIGFAPEASRFFTQLLLVFLIQQMAAGLFRFICGVGRTQVVAHTGGSLGLLLLFLLGFILPRDDIPNWLGWAYWFSPIPYAFSSLISNEMLSPRWNNKMASDNVTSLGVAVLKTFDFSANRNWIWVSAAILFGFAVLLNILYTFALTYLRNPIDHKQATISKVTENDKSRRLQITKSKTESLPNSISSSEKIPREIATQQISGTNVEGVNRKDSSPEAVHDVVPKRGMVLPFTALTMSFNAISYFVDMPPIMKEKGRKEDKLQLLEEVTGAFKPGVLTALMGVTGAGKTTLLDVLSGRKTGGHIEEVSKEEKMMFVDEVINLVELDNLKDAIVGLPGITGLSTEQRKRLTIAVELVANPSIIFMDEPTSGLDARAAAIVMRTVRNTVDTGRTVVCTIHQPSIDIFEAFDELLLLKSRGQVIYHGPLGRNSHTVIKYFEDITGVPKIKEEYNPATWMLEVSSVDTEHRLGVDFARHYKSSTLYQRNKFSGKLAIGKETANRSPESSDPLFYRERAAGMYSTIPYAMAQVCVEIPYVFIQTICYTIVVVHHAKSSTSGNSFKYILCTLQSFLRFLHPQAKNPEVLDMTR